MTRPIILITGSSGLIANVLIAGLQHEFRLYGCDRQLSKGLELSIIADICDYKMLYTKLSRLEKIDYIIHLAANPRVEASWDDVLNDNIIGTKNIYTAAQALKVRRVIFASSNHVTGAYEFHPLDHNQYCPPTRITTTSIPRPDSLYGVSKGFGELLARMYYERYALESVCLRIGTVVANDNEFLNKRTESTWLSHRDLVQLVRCSIYANIGFGIYYGVSANHTRFWDISNAQTELGYYPQDGFMLNPA